MKRALSIVVTALVAVSFAGMVWAADATSTDTVTPPAGMSNTGPGDQGSEAVKQTKKTKKKKKKSRKTRKSTRRTTGSGAADTEPHYGTPPLGGPSGTTGTGGSDTGTGGGTGR